MSRLSAAELRHVANGQWDRILIALGLPGDSLTKSSKPCPSCGGTDRFSFTNNHGTGSFVCRGLGRQGGDGFELVMHWLGCDFRTALQEVSAVLGGATAVPLRTATRQHAESAAARGRDDVRGLRRMWKQSLPVQSGDEVDRYVAGRGLRLSEFPAVLRFHPALPYWLVETGNSRNLGSFPAMLAAVQGPDGRVVAIHRTYLTTEGKKATILHPVTGAVLPTKKLKTRSDRVMPGSAIRLFKPDCGRVAIAEGIETALAVNMACGLPTWSCVTANGMQSIILPPEVKEVFITADNDKSGTGQQAANSLADRLQSEGRRVDILVPSTPGFDWLDVVNAEAGGRV